MPAAGSSRKDRRGSSRAGPRARTPRVFSENFSPPKGARARIDRHLPKRRGVTGNFATTAGRFNWTLAFERRIKNYCNAALRAVAEP
jgi:hypothetical protein